VNYTTADGTATTADNDYTAASGTLTFAPGQTSQTVAVNVNGDTKFEPNETFTVMLSAPTNATIVAGTGTGTIQNDDAAPTISIGNVTAAEGTSGTTPFAFAVTLSNASDQPVTVNYTTADGTATTADNDYSAASGTLTFAPGQTSQPIVVSVNGDTKFEPNETFTVMLSVPTNATIVAGTGTGTIQNDATTVPKPTGTLTVTPGVLWPPDHKLVTVAATITLIADPKATVKLISITSSEPDSGLGDGDKPNDIQTISGQPISAAYGTDARRFQLRAERSGRGPGRTYTVTYQLSNAFGSITLTARVLVPHDLGHKGHFEGDGCHDNRHDGKPGDQDDDDKGKKDERDRDRDKNKNKKDDNDRDRKGDHRDGR